jgi:hypothetical protein
LALLFPDIDDRARAVFAVRALGETPPPPPPPSLPLTGCVKLTRRLPNNDVLPPPPLSNEKASLPPPP